MRPVYIQKIARALPGEAVTNDAMEHVLGQVGERPSRARRIVLRNNGIRRRYYAIDPATGRLTHSNARLTAEAVRGLCGNGFAAGDIELLSCGTSTPDQLMPNHAVMVHGELGTGPMETAAHAGICIAGVTALKQAALAVGSGAVRHAVATGSELVSSFLRAGMFESEDETLAGTLERHPELAFRRDFLRWMLSDGAGAMLLGPDPAPDRPSLRIDWIEQLSFAGQHPVCMYAGGNVEADGQFRGWREYPSPAAAVGADAFTVKQDVRLLNEIVVEVTFRQGLDAVRRRRSLVAGDIDWFVAHYSSAYFRGPLDEAMRTAGFVIPEERWYSNLSEVGNVGSASIYLHLEQMLDEKRLSAGQRLLCFVPESGRFSTSFMHLTVVE